MRESFQYLHLLMSTLYVIKTRVNKVQNVASAAFDCEL